MYIIEETTGRAPPLKGGPDLKKCFLKDANALIYRSTSIGSSPKMKKLDGFLDPE